MNTRFSTLVRALSKSRARAALAAMVVAALLPLSSKAGVWDYDGGVTVPQTGSTIIFDRPIGTIATTATGYGPSVSFEIDVAIHDDGTFDVSTLLNGQSGGSSHPASDASSSFPGAGDYYCTISLTGNVTSPLLDGNGDPYIELYDGSTGDGPQTNPFNNLDGSHGATLDSSDDITVSFSGFIAFDGTQTSWNASLNWSIGLTPQ